MIVFLPSFLLQVTGVKCGGHLMDSFLKELLPMAPIMYFKAVVVQETWEAHQVGYGKYYIYIGLFRVVIYRH